MLFYGLSCAFDLFPEECRATLELPQARDLAQEFAARVKVPQHYNMWIDMLTACCMMGFNPPGASQGMSLLEALLKHLPATSRAGFSLHKTLDMLLSLRHVYGLPVGGRVAAALEPYRRNLADAARRSQRIIQSNPHYMKAWWGPRRKSVDVTQLLESYSSLL